MNTDELPESPEVPLDLAAETEAEGNSNEGVDGFVAKVLAISHLFDLVSVVGGLRGSFLREPVVDSRSHNIEFSCEFSGEFTFPKNWND